MTYKSYITAKTSLLIKTTVNINMNSKLAGTTMGKNSFEGVMGLKRAGLVSTFRTVYSARLQEDAGLLVVVELMYGWRDALLGGKDRSCPAKCELVDGRMCVRWSVSVLW